MTKMTFLQVFVYFTHVHHIAPFKGHIFVAAPLVLI